MKLLSHIHPWLSTGTVDSFARITAKHLGKLVVTSCQRQFGPALGGGEAISLTAEAIKKSGVGLKLLLAEAGLVLPESPDHEVALSVEPRILVRLQLLLLSQRCSDAVYEHYCSFCFCSGGCKEHSLEQQRCRLLPERPRPHWQPAKAQSHQRPRLEGCPAEHRILGTGRSTGKLEECKMHINMAGSSGSAVPEEACKVSV